MGARDAAVESQSFHHDSSPTHQRPEHVPSAPTAVLRPQRRLSLAWLIPCAALLFAGWLAFQAWRSRGVHISIEFDDGYGLAAGDLVRFRGTPVGEVRDVRLAEDLHSVMVSVALRSDATQLARSGSRFWIVRPQLRVDEVRGLETLIGPRYIAALPPDIVAGAERSDARESTDPHSSEVDFTPQYTFIGLSSAPIVDRIEPGDLEVVVQATSLGSLRRGAPVLYRQIAIGTVLSVGLAGDGSAVEARLHIEKPFVSLIRQHTRFWDAGGVRFDAGLTGLSLELDSLSQLVTGAVALATPPIDQAGDVVLTGHRFMLAAEPDDDWLEWEAITSIGNELLPPGAAVPAPLRATVGWQQTRLLVFSTSTSRQGWVLPTREGLLGPADLLAPVDAAQGEPLMLELAGTSIELPEKPLWSQNGLALIGATIDQPLWRDPVTNRAETDEATPAKASTRAARGAPEDCLAFADASSAPLSLSAARLSDDGTMWRIDAAVPVDKGWHGSPVLARRDGRLIGMILVNARAAQVALLP